MHPTSNWSNSILMQRRCPLGVSNSKCCKKRLSRQIAVSLPRENNPTPPKVECIYLHAVQIFLLTPRYGKAWKAKCLVNSPRSASGTAKVPYQTLLNSCNWYETQASFGCKCPFFSLSNQKPAHAEIDFHLSFCLPLA